MSETLLIFLIGTSRLRERLEPNFQRKDENDD